MTLHLGVITIMPEMFSALNAGVVGRAIEQERVRLNVWNLRDWADTPNRQVDDKPYGGGPGMVLQYTPMRRAIDHARQCMPPSTKVVYLSPQGRRITQKDLNKVVAASQSIVFLSGRYEGMDERIITHHVDEEWSLGDFVLSGGELAAMVFIDAIIRLLPGCLGHHASAHEDSFMRGLLDYPQYTRPASVDGFDVPAVLLSGSHATIADWRRKHALGNTWLKRPDLLEKTVFGEDDKRLLDEFKNERVE